MSYHHHHHHHHHQMPIDSSNAWSALFQHKTDIIDNLHLRDLLHDEARTEAMITSYNDIVFDYSRQNATEETMHLLFDLAKAANLDVKRGAMFNGDRINSTENRSVFHMALRASKNDVMPLDGIDQVPLVHAVLGCIKTFTTNVRNEKHLGATGKKLKNIIAVGIGGSYLGPEFVYEALRIEKNAAKASKGLNLRFLANVDPVDFGRATYGLAPDETIVVVISKTFTTAETMLNAKTLKDWLLTGMSNTDPSKVIKQHMVAASSNVPAAEAFGIDKNNVFGFWDWVGGRYSVWSAVGMLPLSLFFGSDIMEQFLTGGRDIDKHFYSAPPRSNIPILMGLLGIWNSSFLQHNCRAILPYSQALVRFPAHVQQLDMESNGKRVSIDGNPLNYETGEIILGEPGTNGQHSFYQLIHQGRTIPCEFIGFCKSQLPIKIDQESVSNHDELMCNFFAQPDALAKGKTEDELENEKVPVELRPHKIFPGNRPSFSLLFGELNAYTAGQLLAIYEHRVFVEGAIWNINSFDQWGVELGKVLANKIRQEIGTARLNRKEEINTTTDVNISTKNLLNYYLKKS